ncbi:MAG: 50S ribosomal protein L19e [Nanoarchaeota archaeon]|nr:50S ribosomal protein L19e [Nanoarchaeota archaeon]
MKLTAQKRMAADILDVGENRVCFDSLRLDEIKQAITKQDIRDLIKDRAIRKRPGVAKVKKERRKRTGAGRRKFKVKTRKRDYINKIRKIRTYVRDQMNAKSLDKALGDAVRKYAKAGQFKNLRQAKEYIKINKK